MEQITKKHKHLTLDDRLEIQECLTKGMTFKAIGRRIGKDQTTISKEVKAHLQSHANSFVKTDQPCPHLLKAPLCVRDVSERAEATVLTLAKSTLLPKPKPTMSPCSGRCGKASH